MACFDEKSDAGYESSKFQGLECENWLGPRHLSSQIADLPVSEIQFEG